MTHSSSSTLRVWTLLLFSLLLFLTVALPGRAQASQPAQSTEPEQERISTTYFTIYYPDGEEETATWYAGYADDVNVMVSELLGAEPVKGLTLRIFATEEEYIAVNPLAETHSILAHAIPAKKEIGVAVGRLRQAPPELARESFRHEMTHIVAAELSGQNMPVGFQEGLAQYNELSSSRGEDVAKAMLEVQQAGGEFLSWTALNDLRAFRGSMEAAYPQTYSIMAFLADRYGMGAYGRFLAELRAGLDWPEAIETAYGRSVAELEGEWREYLPGFLKDGWRVNLLEAYDLTPALDLYKAGQFAQAGERFARSEALYRDLARPDRAAEAAIYRANAEKALGAGEKATAARKALGAYNYAEAKTRAAEASTIFADLELTAEQAGAEGTAELARGGEAALAALEKARRSRESWNFIGAQVEARQASQALADLGDTQRLAEANSILADLWLWQWGAGATALGLGALTLLSGSIAILRGRRRATRPLHRPLQEETPSWL